MKKSKKEKSILLTGIPRCGSTWAGKVLSSSEDLNYVHEPDEEKKFLKAWITKKKLHRYPYLASTDKQQLFFKLWEKAFYGKSEKRQIEKKSRILYRIKKKLFFPRKYFFEWEIGNKCGLIHKNYFRKTDYSKKDAVYIYNLKKNIAEIFARFDLYRPLFLKRRNLVKSVHSIFALEWIKKKFDIDIVILIRHPANIISSYLEFKLGDSIRNIFFQKDLVSKYFLDYMDSVNKAEDKIEKMAVQIGAFYNFIDIFTKKYPDVILIKHEELLYKTEEKFKILFKKLNINWSKKTETYIKNHNKKGAGMHLKREKEKLKNKYKKLLSSKQIEKIKKFYNIFENRYYNNFKGV